MSEIAQVILASACGLSGMSLAIGFVLYTLREPRG